jgi:transcription termination factor NusB
VIIDVAVVIAKLFGTEESSKFINGVLERVANDLTKAGRLDPQVASGEA